MKRILQPFGMLIGIAFGFGFLFHLVGSGRLGVTGFWSLVLLFVVAFLYFLPYFIAKKRKHHQTTAIGLLNLFLGWTFLGWVGALIWSATNPRPLVVAPPHATGGLLK